MFKTPNLIGQKFNKLTVMCRNGKMYERQAAWKCICDCGNEKTTTTKNLISGFVKSCGCINRPLNCNNPKWTGYGEVSGRFIGAIRREAERRGIKFDLNAKYLWELFLLQNRKCKLSGMDIVFGKNSREQRTGKNTASLDRIDSNKPYEVGNVQWVHKDINFMKYNFSEEYFLELCYKVINNMGPLKGEVAV